MIKLSNISNIYFIGIGGIGMSAIARHFNSKGIKVSGYDKSSGILSKELEKEGIHIHYEDNIELIDKNANIVVYTPAIPAEHSELNFYRNNNYTVLKRSDILEYLTQDSFNICIAGTHGKTTISTMIAHILRFSGIGCTTFLGGISINYNTNYWNADNNICVVEADEYDRSFLKLYPNIAIISAMDPDHLDVYVTVEAFEIAFIEFSKNCKEGGTLISKFGLKRSNEFQASKAITYSLNNSKANVYASNIVAKEGRYSFDIVTENETIHQFELNIGGMHNVENSVVAIRTVIEMGVDIQKIRSAVAAFKGVKRRFEYIVQNEGDNNIYMDDYAHHPAELQALITSVKNLFPDKFCTVIFQPHLYSRTKDLADEFAKSLDLADEVVLLPVYPARELPLEGVSSKMIFDKMKLKSKILLQFHEVTDWLMEDNSKVKNKIYITAGAGDIDQLVIPFQRILMEATIN